MLTRLAGNKKIALLGALCLFLSAIEYLIPKPLPFMRIGIANLPLMLALDILPFPALMLLALIKVLGHALITGTLFSYVFVFSIAGTFSSVLLMYALRRLFSRHISFIGIGVSGAMVSNSAQLALAWFFIFKDNVRYIAPPFLAAGLVTGVLLGAFCEFFIRRSDWYVNLFNAKDAERDKGTVNSEQCQITNPRSPFPVSRSLILFITGLIVMLAIVFIPGTKLRIAIFLLLWFLVLLYKKKTNPLFTILMIVVIVAFNLIIPYGRVLFSVGPFAITSGALQAGIHRAVTLQTLVMLSKLTISENLKLPGAFGGLLSESLRIFSIMMNGKIKLSKKNLIANIDTMLLELSK